MRGQRREAISADAGRGACGWCRSSSRSRQQLRSSPPSRYRSKHGWFLIFFFKKGPRRKVSTAAAMAGVLSCQLVGSDQQQVTKSREGFFFSTACKG